MRIASRNLATVRRDVDAGLAQPQSGMSACGVIVLNPPWKVAAELAVVLPVLMDVLGRDAGRFYAIDRLEGEPRERTAGRL
jgi:23S rRNA A2030 N6-methylase RlmJ